MIGFSHALSGAALYLSAAPLMHITSYRDLIVGSVVAMGAAVLPDLDHPEARPARWLGPITRRMSRAIADWSGGHRKGTHALVAWVLVTILATIAVRVDIHFTFVLFCSGLGLYALRMSRWLTLLGAIVLTAWCWKTYESSDWTWLVTAVSTGYIAHLLGDSMTPGGVPWGYPFSRVRLSAHLFSTGGRIELGLITPMLGLTAGYLMIIRLSLEDALYIAPWW